MDNNDFPETFYVRDLDEEAVDLENATNRNEILRSLALSYSNLSSTSSIQSSSFCYSFFRNSKTTSNFFPQQKQKQQDQHETRTIPVYTTLSPINDELRYRIGLLLCNQKFQLFVICTIVFNTILLGVETSEFFIRNHSDYNYNEKSNISRWLLIIDRLDFSCLCFFTFEIVLQILYHQPLPPPQPLGQEHDCHHQHERGWLMFDYIIVLLSWFFYVDSNIILSHVDILRSLRILKALRLISRIQELADLVTTIAFFSLPYSTAQNHGSRETDSAVCDRWSFLFLSMLILLINYCFCVIFTQLFHENGNSEYFSSLFQTAFTLFQIFTLDSWSSVCRDLMKIHSWAWIPIIFYISSTWYIFVSIIMAFAYTLVIAHRSPTNQHSHDNNDRSNIIKNTTPDDVEDQKYTHQIVGTEHDNKSNTSSPSMNVGKRNTERSAIVDTEHDNNISYMHQVTMLSEQVSDLVRVNQEMKNDILDLKHTILLLATPNISIPKTSAMK